MEDRALVAAMISGDPRGLDGAYRRYAPQLRAYCGSLLGDGDAAADAVHDTFVLAGERIGQLRDPDRLRPWLYTIARNECLRHRRGRARLTALSPAHDPAADTVDLTAAVHADQVRELVHAAAAGLTGGDRDVIELALRHGLAAADVAAVLGVSTNHAHARLSRARGRLEDAIGVLLLARSSAGSCPTLAGLLDGWTGVLDPLLRKRLSRHLDRCTVCSQARDRLVHPAALLAAFTAGPALGAAGTWWFGADHPAGPAGPAGPADPPGPLAGDPPDVHPSPPSSSPARSRGRAARRVAGAAAAILVFVAIAATLTRVADPEALAGQRAEPPAVAPPAATPSATPSVGQETTLTPGDEATAASPSGSTVSTKPADGGGDSGNDITKGDLDGASQAPVAFALTVEHFDLSCAADGKTYVLSVRVRGTRPVNTASVYWRKPGDGADDLALGMVDRMTRGGSRGNLRLSTIEWWVEADAVGGGHAVTVKRTATNPCH